METVGVKSIVDLGKLQDKGVIRREFPGIREGAVKRPVGAVGLLISMTERRLHSHGGVEKGKLRLSQTPLGCGQVLKGVETSREKAGEGERISAECRSLQGASAAQPVVGKSFQILALTRATDAIL